MGNTSCHCTDGSQKEPTESEAPVQSVSAFVEEVPSRAPVLPPETGGGSLTVPDGAPEIDERNPLAVAAQAKNKDEGSPKLHVQAMDMQAWIDSAGAQKGHPRKKIIEETFDARLPIPMRPIRSTMKTMALSEKTPLPLHDPKLTRATFLLLAGSLLKVSFESYGNPSPMGSLVVTSVSKDSVLYKPLFGRKGVRLGDVVVEVNGCSGSAKMLFDLLQQAKLGGGNLNVTLRRRPKIFEVSLVKTSPDQDMGFEVAVDDGLPDRLIVKCVYRQGALPAWRKQNPTLHVFSGDWITAIQGRRCTAKEMSTFLHSLWESGTANIIAL